MTTHRLTHRAREPGIVRSFPARRMRVGAVALRGHVIIVVVGALALGHLVLTWRAVDLDAQVVLVEDELAQARLEVLRARREMFATFSPAALADETANASRVSTCAHQDLVPCAELPPLETCVLTDAGGHSSTEAAAGHAAKPTHAAPSRIARTPHPDETARP